LLEKELGDLKEEHAQVRGERDEWKIKHTAIKDKTSGNKDELANLKTSLKQAQD
jgi:hypothetical protein